MKLSQTPWRKRALNGAALLLAARVMWRVVRPNVYLFVWTFQRDGSDHAPETDAADVRRLASMGPDVIGPILRSIKANTPWSKTTAMLPSVLKEIGQPAHDRLRGAIQSETRPSERNFLIDTLQDAFDDYTFLPLYLDAIATSQSGSQRYLRSQLISYTIRHADELPLDQLNTNPKKGSADSIILDVPTMMIDQNGGARRLNPEFVKWYALVSKPKGPLPYWRPRQNPNAQKQP